MAEYDNCSDQAEGGHIIKESLCQPCANEHITITADIYCETCAEFQCGKCSKVHKKISFMKGHKLKRVNRHSDCSFLVDMKGIDTCLEHSKQFLYFCVDDDMLLCSSCILSKHRRCENIHELDSDSIKSRCEKISKQNLSTALSKLKSSAITMAQDLQEAKGSIGKNLEGITEMIDAKRDSMIDKFEELKVKITSDIANKEKESEKRIEEITAKSSDKIDSITTLEDILPDVLDHGTPSQTFILHQVVAKQSTAFQRFKDENSVKPYRFVLEVSPHLRQLLAPNHQLATLQTSPLTTQGANNSIQTRGTNSVLTGAYSNYNNDNSMTTRKIKLEEKATQTDTTPTQKQLDSARSTTVPVKSSELMELYLKHSIHLNDGPIDRHNPFYSGMDFLSDGRLVAIDCDNTKMMIYSESLVLLESYKLRGRRNAIAVITDHYEDDERDEVAVTDGDFSQIQFFHISKSNQVTFLRSVSTSSKCESISYMGSYSFLVSTYEDKRPLRMIDIYGEEEDFINIKTKYFKFDNNKCTYVTKADMLALTDRYANTVYLYTRCGNNVTWQAVKDTSMIEFPRDICEGPDKSVIVCSEGTDSLVQVSTSGTILTSIKLEMLAPCTVCRSKDGTRLAVSNCVEDRQLQIYEIYQ